MIDFHEAYQYIWETKFLGNITVIPKKQNMQKINSLSMKDTKFNSRSLRMWLL